MHQLKQMYLLRKLSIQNDEEIFSFMEYRPYQGEWDDEWCVKHWGTKWDACSSTMEIGESFVEFLFDTAWCPPSLDLLLDISALHPGVTVELEYGGDYAGRIVCLDGKLVSHAQWIPLRGDDEDDEDDDE